MSAEQFNLPMPIVACRMLPCVDHSLRVSAAQHALITEALPLTTLPTISTFSRISPLLSIASGMFKERSARVAPYVPWPYELLVMVSSFSRRSKMSERAGPLGAWGPHGGMGHIRSYP